MKHQKLFYAIDAIFEKVITHLTKEEAKAYFFIINNCFTILEQW